MRNESDSDSPSNQPGLASIGTREDSRFHTIIADSKPVAPERLEFTPEDRKKLEDIFEHYELMEQFSEGGQGILQTGLDKALQRYVAIKSLKPNFTGSDEIVSGFVTEAKITAQLDHPSIIPLYGVGGDDKGGVHISMKLVHGYTLRELVLKQVAEYQSNSDSAQAREPHALKARLERFIKVCDAISYAHSKSVVHRDLKPENIMVGSFHQVYVMDWGLARVCDEKESLADKGVSGTPGYIAPETLRRQGVTAAADQYSLGQILFELITLKSRILGTRTDERVDNTLKGVHRPLAHRFEHVSISADIKAVVEKATQPRPEDRYASVDELATDLRRFLNAEEVLARPDNGARKALRFLSRHRALTAAGVMLLLLASASITIFSLASQKAAVEASKQRELKLVSLHRAIENRAHAIDSHFLTLSNVLQRYTDKIEFLLEHPSVPRAPRIFDYRSFNDPARAPPETVHSSLYGQRVNLSYGNYALAPGLAPGDAEGALKAVTPLIDGVFEYLVDSDPNPRAGGANLERVALETGFPIRWIYFGLANGLIVSYPGNGNLPDGYDPRLRPWYQLAKGTHRVQWSAPYVDAFGQGVIISASESLRDGQGEFLGVASMDITFDYTKRRMIADVSEIDAVVSRQLLDSDGNVVLAPVLNSQRVQEAAADFSTLKLERYEHPQIVERLGTEESGQFEVNERGRVALIVYAPIHTLGWYLVEKIDLEKYLGAGAN